MSLRERFRATGIRPASQREGKLPRCAGPMRRFPRATRREVASDARAAPRKRLERAAPVARAVARHRRSCRMPVRGPLLALLEGRHEAKEEITRSCPTGGCLGAWQSRGRPHHHSTREPQAGQAPASTSRAIRLRHTGHAADPAAAMPSQTRSSRCSSVSLPPPGAARRCPEGRASWSPAGGRGRRSSKRRSGCPAGRGRSGATSVNLPSSGRRPPVPRPARRA